MKASLLALVTASSLIGCIQQDSAPDDLQHAIPTAEQVRINLPEGGNAKTVGQLADWYVATRNVTRTFNGGSAWVLVLVHTIVQYPVTSVSGDTYTWGPWHDALDPAEYKLDVTDNGDGTYDYALSGRSRTETTAQFEKIIEGFSDPRDGVLQGNGTFRLDFEASRRVNPIDADPDARGSMAASYDLQARHLDLAIATTNDAGEPVAADYAYNEAADGGGDMVFSFNENAGGTAAQEQVVLRSRWQATGTGRSDARLSGGDLTTAAIASECWGETFKRTYYTDNASFAPTEGDATACAFPTADLPPEM